MAVTVSSMPNHIKEMKGIQSFTKIAKDDLTKTTGLSQQRWKKLSEAWRSNPRYHVLRQTV